MQRLILATIALLLSACGWQLSNSQVVPSNIGSLYIEAQVSQDTFVSALTRALDVYGVDVVSNSVDARYSIVIIDYRHNRRIATLNSSAQAAEFQLNEDLDFLIADPSGTPLTKILTASVERSYEIERANNLSSDNEEQLVRIEMREEIVRQILNRLKVLPAQYTEQKQNSDSP